MQRKLILTFNEGSNIEEVDYTDILPSSYLDYSVSVIMDRAVPNIFDGLKPVQRRILFSMYDSGFTQDKPYRKTARVSGDVIGRYHPHGSSGCETAIVTMAQPFKKPITFIDGQGNWGSVEGDSPAAARYTECRLTEFSEEVLLDLLYNDTVDFQPNYDNTLKEPVVLPVKVPNVLITGAEGIAVGMRTNIPTFNLSEIIDAYCYVLTHKKVSTDKILEFMPAPDFASGGIICNPTDMKSLYETGTGKVRIRAKVEFQKGVGKKHDRLIVTEVPYTMVGSSIISFLEDVVNLIESGDLTGVIDVIDQTGEFPRLVLELSKDADVNYILDVLYSRTKLEDTMSCNLLVVHDGKPETVGVVSILQQFAEFSKNVYRRKYAYDISKYQSRRNVLEAYRICTGDIDKVVSIVRSSKSVTEAKQRLCETYSFNKEQVNAVLALKISRLVALERDRVIKELNQVNKAVEECQAVLSDDSKLVRRMVSELNAIDRKYGYSRRTQVLDIPVTQVPSREEPDKQVYVLVDRFLYVHSVDLVTYTRNKECITSEFKFSIATSYKSTIMFMCEDGTRYMVKVKDIPLSKLRSKGIPLDNLTGGKFSTKDDVVVSVLSCDSDNIICISRKGKGKQLTNKELTSCRVQMTYMVLDSEDRIVYCGIPSENYLLLMSNLNRYLKIDKDSIPFKKKGSKGVNVVKFKSCSDFVQSVQETSNSKNVQSYGLYAVKLSKKEAQNLL